MFNLSKREKNLICLCLFMLVLILYYNFYLSHALRDAYNIYGNIKSYNLKIQDMSSIKKCNEHTYKGPNNEKNKEYEYSSNSKIASNLKLMADESKINIKELIFNDINKDESIYDKFKVNIITVNACAIGNYNSLIEFIEKINKQKFCSTNNVIIKRQNNNMQLNIDVNYYYISYKEDDKSVTRE